MNDHWGEYGVFSFPIDCDAVLKHLRQDMRDDWFPDLLQYTDLFASKDALQKTIVSEIESGHGQYSAVSRQLRDIPKKGLGIRYALETDFYDRFIYQAICSYLISFYDPLLSNRVFGHRLNTSKKSERYLFKNRLDLWRTFEGITHTAITGEKALLATDLINYYENISIDLVRSSFIEKLDLINATGREKISIRNAVAMLCDLMKSWGFSSRHGLPQNRDASSFIANVVLCDTDKRMAALGFDYYRYVDDIRLICQNPTEARKALNILIGELRLVGMNINSSKTAILTRVTDEKTIGQFFPAMDERSIAIDTMWRSRSRKVISRSIALVYELLSELIKEKDTQSRQFRFAVNRLCMLMEAGHFDVGGELSAGLLNTIFDQLEVQAVSTDQFCRLLSVFELSQDQFLQLESFLGDSGRSISSWQNFHLWMLLAKKEWKSNALIAIAQAKISQDITAAEVAAIFVYLKAVGEDQTILLSHIEKFTASWPYQHQRNYLLALKDASQEQLRPLVAKLGPRLVGTIKRAKSHFSRDGKIVPSQQPAELLDLFDHISPYD